MDSVIILSNRIDTINGKLAKHEERLNKLETVLKVLEDEVIRLDISNSQLIDKLEMVSNEIGAIKQPFSGWICKTDNE